MEGGLSDKGDVCNYAVLFQDPTSVPYTVTSVSLGFIHNCRSLKWGEGWIWRWKHGFHLAISVQNYPNFVKAATDH